MMEMRRTLLIVAFLLCRYDLITACTCGGGPSPCESYVSASAVCIGYVKRVEPDKPAGEEYVGEQKAYVRVEQSFKGVKEFAEVIFHQPADMCSPKFKVGDRW